MGRTKSLTWISPKRLESRNGTGTKVIFRWNGTAQAILTRERQGGGNADGDGQRGEPRPLTQDEAQNIAALGAERDANAKFRRALGDAVGDQAVDADRRKHHSDSGKDPKKKHGEARAGKGIR